MKRNQCLTDDELHRVVSAHTASDVGEQFQDHLDACEHCCQRLEELAGSAGPPPGVAQTEYHTDALDHAIEKLKKPQSGHTNAFHEQTLITGERMAQALPFLQPPLQHAGLGRIGHYEVTEVIGQGGMGVVLKAVDPALKRIVAIKALHVALATNPDAHARFLREGRSIAAVRHDGIVSIHHISECDGVPFLVMEYVAGESLADRLERDESLPWEEVVRIGLETANALHAAHVRGLVHRDIKPGNVLLEGETGRVKVTDFGLAKTNVDEAITQTGLLAGTPEYMSPEQASEKDLDPRSDLFSLGTVLYAACSGQSPFRASSALATIRRICDYDPPGLTEVAPQVPDWFSAVVEGLLQKDPKQRIQSATRLATLLNSRRPPPPARPTKLSITPPSLAKAVPSGSWFAATALLVLITAVITAYAAGVFGGREDEPLAAPPQPVRRITLKGKPDSFDTVEAALQAAADTDVVVLAEDGPFLVRPLKIQDKRITIRAAPGAKPIFYSQTPQHANAQPFLSSNADVVLEGIELHWSLGNASRPLDSSQMIDLCALRVHGNLELKQCTITVGEADGCVGVSDGSLKLSHCRLISKQGIGVYWGASSQSKLEVDDSIFEGVGAFCIGTTGTEQLHEPAPILMRHSTLICDHAFRLIVESRFNQKLGFTLENNLIVTPIFIRLQALRRFPRLDLLQTSRHIRTLMGTRIECVERSNVYQANTEYARFFFPPRDQRSPMSAAINSLDLWQRFWHTESAGSLAIDMQVEPPLDNSLPPTVVVAPGEPELPPDIGARIP